MQTFGCVGDVVVAVAEGDVGAEQSPVGACVAFVGEADTAGVDQPSRAYLAVELMVGVADDNESRRLRRVLLLLLWYQAA